MVVPPDTLKLYVSHLNEGCNDKCSTECLNDDTVYNEWKHLRDIEPSITTPEKSRNKRKKFNQKELRKKLKLAGKEYVTSKGKKVQSVEPVKWVTCRCKKRCGENLDLNERNTLYDNYWSLDSDSQKKQYILGCVRKVPRQREGSRKNFVWRYSFENSLQEEVEVCKAVFENTLQIKRKRIRYTLNNSGQGFAKPDQRGMNTPKHKLSIERKAGVIAHIRSFPTVPSHYSRKTSKCIYIQDTTNFS